MLKSTGCGRARDVSESVLVTEFMSIVLAKKLKGRPNEGRPCSRYWIDA